MGYQLQCCRRLSGLQRHEALLVSCPEGCPAYTVYVFANVTSRVYSTDSCVCASAIHGGLINGDQGGKVLVTFLGIKGTDWPPTTANGISSSAWTGGDDAMKLS